MSRVLLANEYISVDCDAEARVVTLTRTAADLPRESADIRQVYREVVDALEGIERKHYAIIADGRAATGRNDAAFESVHEEFLGQIFGGFRHVATVVGTMAGRLQVGRYNADPRDKRISLFATPEEARAYLAELT